MNRKVRWGILGCASIAKQRVIPGLLQAENAELYAVASRGAKKRSEMTDLFQVDVFYDSYEGLLEDENVDAVYIPLPNALHFEWVKKAAKAGKHILCEKPMVLCAQEAEEMFSTCEKERVLLMEAFAYRHAPLIQTVKKEIESGKIGEVKYVESHLTDVLTDMGNIRMNAALGGGAFYDMACYNINAVSYSSLNSYPRGYYCIVGTEGRIEVPCNFNCRYVQKYTVITKGSVNNVEILEEEATDYTVFCPDNYKLEIEQFGRCILNGEKPLISKEETLLNAEILDSLLESVKA